MITVDMIEAKKVVFLNPFFEDDFVERGMTAWLTLIEWDNEHECYSLYFDFTEFEDINEKYFRRTYYSNRFTKMIDPEGRHALYTAKEANMYEAKCRALLNAKRDGIYITERDDDAFAETIKEFLKEVE